MEVGKNIFIKTQGNKARYGVDIIETKISKVGRKYFWVEELPRTKFEIESMQEVTEYTADYKAYESMETIENEVEKIALERKLRNLLGSFGKTNFTLEQLRKVCAILSDG